MFGVLAQDVSAARFSIRFIEKAFAPIARRQRVTKICRNRRFAMMVKQDVAHTRSIGMVFVEMHTIVKTDLYKPPKDRLP